MVSEEVLKQRKMEQLNSVLSMRERERRTYFRQQRRAGRADGEIPSDEEDGESDEDIDPKDDEFDENEEPGEERNDTVSKKVIRKETEVSGKSEAKSGSDVENDNEDEVISDDSENLEEQSDD